MAYDADFWNMLDEAGLLTPDNRATLSDKVQYAEDLTKGLGTLHRAGILTQQNFTTLCEQAEHAYRLAVGLSILHNAEILTTQNITILIEQVQYADRLAVGLSILHNAEMLTTQNITTLIEQAQYAGGIASGLGNLHRAGILTPEIRTAFIANIEYAVPLIAGMDILNYTGILTEQNFTILTKQSQYAVKLALGIITLHSAEILTPENLAVLQEQAQHAEMLAHMLIRLDYSSLLTPENRSALLGQAQHTTLLSYALYSLDNSEILNQDNFTTLCEILNQDNFTTLCEQAHHADLVVWGLATLHKAGVKIEKSKQPSDQNSIYKTIYANENNLFSKQEKIAAFFLAWGEDLKRNLASTEINKLLADIKPKSLSNEVKKIFHKMGGYSFMLDDAKNITLGFEVEYSGISSQHSELIKFVMKEIQSNWSHPGDRSVEPTDEKSYGGEATTPIIANNNELKNAMINVAFLQAMGGEANDSCGLHVHIGIVNLETPAEFVNLDSKIHDKSISRVYTAYQFEFIKQFLVIYKREESQFKAIERDYNQFTQPLNLNNIDNIVTLSTLIEKVNPENRYYELNLHAFSKHGTIEIRRFAGTTEETQIYATLSMISAMAEEARAKTNAVFSKRFLDEKMLNPDQPPESLSFFKQRETETKRELFTLKVKPLQESTLTQSYRNAPNTVNIYLDQNGCIAYETHDQHKKILKGSLENLETLQNIVAKLKSHLDLSPQESNQVLLEIAKQGHATLSHRVEKLKSTDLAEKIRAGQLSKKR